jgi:hypothetical protein
LGTASPKFPTEEFHERLMKDDFPKCSGSEEKGQYMKSETTSFVNAHKKRLPHTNHFDATQRLQFKQERYISYEMKSLACNYSLC